MTRLRLTSTYRHVPLFAVLFALLAIGGCDGIFSFAEDDDSKYSVEVAFKALGDGAVRVEEIDRGQYGDIVEGTQTVIRAQEAYASFWSRLHADRASTPSRPEVDFDQRVVVALVLGERRSGGYTTRVAEALASENGEEIQVQYTETVPGDGCAVTTALTAPYALVAVEAQTEEFTFTKSEETRSC